MKLSPWNILRISSFASCLLASTTFAAPIDFNEVSLLVRARESEPSIAREVGQRKLLHPLTPQQESTLKAQGARDSLIQSLRRSDFVLPAADATAYEAAREQNLQGRAERPTNRSAASSDNVHILNVAFGHPINLSQFGGLDCEIAFYSYRFAGENYIEPVMIDNVRSVTEVSRPVRFMSEDEAFASDFFPTNSVRNTRFIPYSPRGDFRDNRLNLNDTVSVRSNSASRTLTIDWQNPVYMQGQPYAFYPVYGAGGVSLYYIGGSSQSVKLAVSTSVRR